MKTVRKLSKTQKTKEKHINENAHENTPLPIRNGKIPLIRRLGTGSTPFSIFGSRHASNKIVKGYKNLWNHKQKHQQYQQSLKMHTKTKENDKTHMKTNLFKFEMEK